MTYLLRVNLDIEDKNPGKSPRLQAAVKTIKSLLKKDNRVVVLSHFGRLLPRRLVSLQSGQAGAKFDPELSLKRFHKVLEKKLGEGIVFFPKFDFEKIRATITTRNKTRLFMLENLRFMPGEEKNSVVFARQLASLGDRYMNDDFATSHRKEASLVAITKFLPSVPGPTLLDEVNHLKKVAVHPKKPFTLVIGGAKMEDKIGVVKHLLPKVDYILMGGGAANTFLKASGVDIKASIFEPKILQEARKLLKSKKIIVPIDYRWSGNKILDIGPRTIATYSKIIKTSGTIVWGGPMGYFEDKDFNTGSYKIARAIAASKSFSVVGGGETGNIITNLGLQKKISFLSLGGGAMLAFLAHKEMPGLKALKIRH